ncbi:MAG: hypothetical protein LHV69_02460 [Elusimicrobia bacterium]|nr:hypothetical protein [Candidatus Obscuribacterium magneticum]MCB4755886.1 hypothetical protein [Candidatus Obscuribacterium magneticum]
MVNRRIQKSIVFIAGFFSFWMIASFGVAGTKEVIKIRENVLVKEGETVERAVGILSSVQVEGNVQDSVVSVMGNVTLGPKAVVKGDVVSVGGAIIKTGGAKIGGKEVTVSLPFKQMGNFLLVAAPLAAGMGALVIGIGAILGSLGFVALVILVLALFEPPVLAVSRRIHEHPWASFIIGVLGFCLLVPILIAMAITIIGIPLAFLGAAIAMAAMILGVVGTGHLLGFFVTNRLKKPLRPLWTGLLGLVLLMLVGFIPLLGIVIKFCVIFVGLGAVILTRFGTGA